jgi:molybdopterin converting factor subunit 1
MIRPMMRIEVLCFAGARDVVGSSSVALALEPGTTVEGAVAILASRHAGLAAYLPALRTAVNEEFAPGTQLLREGDVLALLPPVSGG